MKLNLSMKTAASILFGAAVLLLIVNLMIMKFGGQTKLQSDKSIINTLEIDSLFRFSLYSFNIKEDWINEHKKTKTIKSYRVKVPTDLSIPVILVEVNSNFWSKDVLIKTEEKEISGRTILEIVNKNDTKLRSEIYYDDQIKRSAGSFAFILEDFELTGKEDSLLFEIPEPFSTLLIPSTQNANMGKYILDKNKTYSVLLNDDISELKYRLSADYSNNRLEGSLISIISNFSGAVFFFVDDQSDLFNSTSYSFIRDELSKRNIQVARLNWLKRLRYEEPNDLSLAFDNAVKGIGDNQSAVFLLNREEFKTLLPEIKQYKKIGYVILHHSEVKLN